METSELDKYIEDGYGPVERFLKACEEMPTVKFILAERKISELLITVATSSVLQSVVSSSSRGFDFRAALSRSRIRTGKRYSILPPAPPPEPDEGERKHASPVITVTVTPALSEVAVADLIDRVADVCDVADAEGCSGEEKKALYAVSTALAEAVKSCDAVRIRSDFDAFADFIRSSALAGRLGESADNLNETLEHYGI